MLIWLPMLWLHRLDDNNRSDLNGNNRSYNNNLANDNTVRGMALSRGFIMKTHKSIYSEIISLDNLILAWQKARKKKTQKGYVVEFEKNLFVNLNDLHLKLRNNTYKPKPLVTFILRDPKTRKISKSDFRDRIVHHAIINVLEPIFDKSFIYDSCANRKGKGNLFALKRFEEFIKKVSKNGNISTNPFDDSSYVRGYCFKADIKHYFQEVDRNVLIGLIERKIKDQEALNLIKAIIVNSTQEIGGGATDLKRDASWQFNKSILCKYLS